MLSPTFSIIIPCYNQAHYLPDCLNSLIRQNYQNWEAIIINDGSTDSTAEVGIYYSNEDSRIKYFEKTNGGLSSARNYGLNVSLGKRILFLDSDDYLYDHCLSEIFDTRKVDDDNLVIRYGYTYVNEKGLKELYTYSRSSWETLIPNIFYNNIGPVNSICISKTTSMKIGGFDESLKSVEDWDYWIRISKSGAKLYEIKKALVYYRYGKTSMSRNAFVMYDAFKKVMQRAIKFDPRINTLSEFNKDYNIDNSAQLQSALIRMLGVSIMQGKIEESLKLFKTETLIPAGLLKPKDFESMCSYLTFRYWYAPEDLRDVFDKYFPNYKSFFEKAGYSKPYIQKALYHIFKFHLFHKNKIRYGKYFGKVINFYYKKSQKIAF